MSLSTTPANSPSAPDVDKNRGSALTRVKAPRLHGGRLILALFVFVMLAPTLANLFGMKLLSGNFENRIKAKPPAFGLSYPILARVPKGFTAYYNDRFGLRNAMIRSYVLFRRHVMGAVQINKVLLGNDGWLFLKEELAYKDPIATHQGVNLLTASELQALGDVLAAWSGWMEARGMRFVLMTPPDKADVMRRHLPGQVRVINPYNRTDQFLDYMRTRFDFPIIDPRPILAARADEAIYYKTDTHWTLLGSYYAHQQLMEVCREIAPEAGFTPSFKSDYRWKVDPQAGGDLAMMLMMGGDDIDRGVGVLPKHTAFKRGPDSPTVALYGDSYSLFLEPFLKVETNLIYPSFADPVDPAMLERERPDVVVFEVVERNLTNLKLLGTEVRPVQYIDGL